MSYRGDQEENYKLEIDRLSSEKEKLEKKVRCLENALSNKTDDLYRIGDYMAISAENRALRSEHSKYFDSEGRMHSWVVGMLIGCMLCVMTSTFTSQVLITSGQNIKALLVVFCNAAAFGWIFHIGGIYSRMRYSR